MQVYRILKALHAATAFSGEGARLYGGRWNSKGVPMVYTSEARSLAVLEVLVHATARDLRDYVMIAADIPDAHVATFDVTVAPDWRHDPRTLQAYGDAWVESGQTAALRVASAVIPEEFNVLLNPRASAFAEVRIESAVAFAFDARASAPTGRVVRRPVAATRNPRIWLASPVFTALLPALADQ